MDIGSGSIQTPLVCAGLKYSLEQLLVLYLPHLQNNPQNRLYFICCAKCVVSTQQKISSSLQRTIVEEESGIQL